MKTLLRHTFLLLLLFFNLTFLFGQKELKIDQISFSTLDDGRLTASKMYEKDSLLDGSYRLIGDSPREYINAQFRDGFTVGKWEHYINDKLDETIHYNDGYKDGEYTVYYVDMTVKEVIPYSKNKINGTVVYYYPNGQKKIEKNWNKGIEDGAEINYNEDGRVWNEINFKDGKQDGKAMSYIVSRDGNYTKTCFYKNGRLDGEWLEIYEDDNSLKTKGDYLNGVKDGEWNYSKKDRTKHLTENYKNGELIRTIDYYANGEPKSEKNYKNDKLNGIVRQYEPGGFVKSERTYANGKEDGKQINHISSNTGNFVETSHYSNGIKDGEYSEVYVDTNNIKSKGNYVNGKKDGKWVYGYKDGMIYKEETYANGELIR